jgi:ABC-type microcin C transport system permease subunit YejE
MPVPYALSANVDPLEITTQKIVDYINDAETTGEDVGQIVTALLNKTAVSNAVRDSIISYIKTQPVKAKELAIYFLGTVTVNDAKQAFDTLTDEVKQEIKRIWLTQSRLIRLWLMISLLIILNIPPRLK